MNSYVYIASHFPNLWFIENNGTYRGFIYDSRNKDRYNRGYYETYIKGAGLMGADFAHYYNGNPKLGDTPSLLYMMDGDPSDPTRESWGGSFEPFTRSARVVLQAPTTACDTVAIYSIMEFHFDGPVMEDLAVGTPCVTLDIANQQWDGYYLGDGHYVAKYSTYKTGTQPYTITFQIIPDFRPLEGDITVYNLWPAQHDRLSARRPLVHRQTGSRPLLGQLPGCTYRAEMASRHPRRLGQTLGMAEVRERRITKKKLLTEKNERGCVSKTKSSS